MGFSHSVQVDFARVDIEQQEECEKKLVLSNCLRVILQSDRQPFISQEEGIMVCC